MHATLLKQLTGVEKYADSRHRSRVSEQYPSASVFESSGFVIYGSVGCSLGNRSSIPGRRCFSRENSQEDRRWNMDIP